MRVSPAGSPRPAWTMASAGCRGRDPTHPAAARARTRAGRRAAGPARRPAAGARRARARSHREGSPSAGTASDIAAAEPGRAQLVAVAERSALAQDRHLERKIGAAHPGTPDRPDANDARAFPDGARVEALHLGLVAPRLALGKKAAAAATR